MKNDDTSFFALPLDYQKEAREVITVVICRLLLWMADAPTLADRGIRASVGLYCIRPDLIDGATLQEIADHAGYTRQAVHHLVRSFRRYTKLTS